jgi:hypothetical protein
MSPQNRDTLHVVLGIIAILVYVYILAGMS